MIGYVLMHCRMWPKIIELLKTQGFSQKALAERVGVDQSTICRLADGAAPEPRFSVGQALIDLAGGPEALRRHGLQLPTIGKPAAEADPTADACQPVLVLEGAAAPQSDVKEGV